MNVKISLCIAKHETIKAFGGGGGGTCLLSFCIFLPESTVSLCVSHAMRTLDLKISQSA